ncbi:Dihydrolipoyllysine-residue acetyltransferase component of pyruvate dehydrogenase complex [Leucoagaricus sp. SymC.cos]|nr:Dihydrolipoyllysine-residue acetyltransferase component of pyruvate dehydrogenase complex [Leucoagaricus sp. SymC.cos]
MSRSLNTVSRVVTNTQKTAQAQALDRSGVRGFHGSLRRQAILMPAMSPLTNEGTITRWKKREGEAFAPGDVLLQIESDIAMIDVEAHSPGILGKIILPDGTTNVPIEQVIALVARDEQELATLRSMKVELPTPPPLDPTASPSSASANSTSSGTQKWRPPPLKTPRTPFFEVNNMNRGFRVNTPLSAGFTVMPNTAEASGTAIRRKIVVSLTGNPPKTPLSRQRDEF